MTNDFHDNLIYTQNLTKRNFPFLLRKNLGTPPVIILIHVIKSTREATEMEINFQTKDGSFHLWDQVLLYFSKHNSFMMHSSYLYVFLKFSEEVKQDFLVDSHGINFNFTGKKENYYQKRSKLILSLLYID